MEQQGSERRIHKVYITRNTEYHLRSDVCVAVRDRRSRSFRPAHIALNLRLEGGVKIYANGALIPNPKRPEIGDAIFFTRSDSSGGEKQIVTSRVEKIDRPSKRDVMLHPSKRS